MAPTPIAQQLDSPSATGRRAPPMLRLVTSGSVDDGKSTLIGRLLYDSKSILADQLEALEIASSCRNGTGALDLALLTDGLRAEREQGITIDVAYRYFQTARRKFIIADTPGHERYTRNMVTGASTADLAVILIDARKGVIEQTRRHSFIASLLGIRHLVVCVNKMDLADYQQSVFERIERSFHEFCARLEVTDVTFIPISALSGDNVVERSGEMPWYEGPSLLYHLEHVHIASDRNLIDCRFPVQWVIRPGPQSERARLPGLCGPDRVGYLPPRRSRSRAAERRADPGRSDRQLRRSAVGGVCADVGQAGARGRRRRLPRRHDLPAAQPPNDGVAVSRRSCAGWLTSPCGRARAMRSSTRPAGRGPSSTMCATGSTSTRCTGTSRPDSSG